MRGTGSKYAASQLRMIRSGEGSEDVIVQIGWSSRCSTGVRIRCNGKSGSVLVSSPISKRTFGRLRGSRVDKRIKVTIIRMGCSPWIRRGIIARRSKRLIGIVVDIADTVVFCKRYARGIFGNGSPATVSPEHFSENEKKKTYPGSAAALALE